MAQLSLLISPMFNLAMDKWIIKQQKNNVPLTNSSIRPNTDNQSSGVQPGRPTSSESGTNRQSSDVQPGTSFESGTNRQTNDVQPGTSSGTNKRPHDAQSTTFTKKRRSPGPDSILRITFNLDSSRVLMTNHCVLFAV